MRPHQPPFIAMRPLHLKSSLLGKEIASELGLVNNLPTRRDNFCFAEKAEVELGLMELILLLTTVSVHRLKVTNAAEPWFVMIRRA